MKKNSSTRRLLLASLIVAILATINFCQHKGPETIRTQVEILQ